MPKEQFMDNPVVYIFNEETFPDAWIAEAWKKDAGNFRSNVSYELSRMISKNGTFHDSRWLQVLSGGLTEEQVVTLYCAIRDTSQRLEPEWRREFEEAFSQHREHLPTMNQMGVKLYFTSRIFWFVSQNQTEEVRRLLPEIKKAGLSVVDLRLSRNELAQFSIDSSSFTESKEDRFSALEVAMQLGFSELAKLCPFGKHVESAENFFAVFRAVEWRGMRGQAAAGLACVGR